MNIENIVKQIIIDILDLSITTDELPSDTPFLEMGLQLDSLIGLRIVLELEKRFDFVIRLGDLTREVFSNINHLVVFVENNLRTKIMTDRDED